MEKARGEMERLASAKAAVRSSWDGRPWAGIVLGTGLGALADAIEVEASLPYESLPHVPKASVQGHAGHLLLGKLDGVSVAAMQGRFHRYEGRTLREAVFLVRVMRMLGAEALFLSGACGGMRPLWSPGDLVLLDDQINLLGDSPLIGPNLDELGPRFPDMSAPFDPGLQRLAMEAALEQGVQLRRGVYAAVPGPQLETRAEYRMLQRMGADVVGMSTVPEVIAARHMGMRVLAVSIITDQCLPDALKAVDVREIIETAKAAEPKVTRLARTVIQRAARAA